MGAGIPVTYVPARNTIFLSTSRFAAAAEVLGPADIFIGVNALDYSGYPDCRPEFIHAFGSHGQPRNQSRLSKERLRTKIHTPLISLSKAEIVRLGHDLGVPFEITLSCYDPDASGRPCGGCDSCVLRARGFEQAGLPDPALAHARR